MRTQISAGLPRGISSSTVSASSLSRIRTPVSTFMALVFVLVGTGNDFS
jgi:hypothetical protein